MPNQPSDLKSFLTAIRKHPFIVLDTETTGIDDNGEVVSIAVVDQRGSTLLQSYVKPTKPISPDATRITGITDAMVDDAPSWAQVRLHLADLLHDKIVVAYNATFDRRIIHQTDRAHGFADTDWQGMTGWYCAMEAFAERYGQFNNYRGTYTWQKLTVACDYYRLERFDAHGAEDDAKATLRLVQAMTADPHCIKLLSDEALNAILP